jgi:predicted CXXCH cytochrome family protein
MILPKRQNLFIVLACALLGSAVWAGIKGSKHDFSGAEWSGGDACSACHTPRSELPAEAPLWDPSADLSERFGGKPDRNLPGAGTTSCLRCHDGTVASPTIAGVTRDRFVNKRHPGIFTAGHGTSNHPVGVDYPGFDPEYQPAPSVEFSRKVMLPNGRVECTSCHDPHNDSGLDYMLVMSNARSALCLQCHIK